MLTKDHWKEYHGQPCRFWDDEEDSFGDTDVIEGELVGFWDGKFLCGGFAISMHTHGEPLAFGPAQRALSMWSGKKIRLTNWLSPEYKCTPIGVSGTDLIVTDDCGHFPITPDDFKNIELWRPE